MMLIQRGELVSVEEAVMVSDVSRQAISRWVKAAGVSVQAKRLAHLAKLRTIAMRRLEGLPDPPALTKKQKRAALERAIKKFNDANGRDSQISDQAAGAMSLLPASGRGGGVP